jgi:hypothetical protein
MSMLLTPAGLIITAVIIVILFVLGIPFKVGYAIGSVLGFVFGNQVTAWIAVILIFSGLIYLFMRLL